MEPVNDTVSSELQKPSRRRDGAWSSLSGAVAPRVIGQVSLPKWSSTGRPRASASRKRSPSVDSRVDVGSRRLGRQARALPGAPEVGHKVLEPEVLVVVRAETVCGRCALPTATGPIDGQRVPRDGFGRPLGPARFAPWRYRSCIATAPARDHSLQRFTKRGSAGRHVRGRAGDAHSFPQGRETRWLGCTQDW